MSIQRNKTGVFLLLMMLVTILIAFICVPAPSHAAEKVFKWRCQHVGQQLNPPYGLFEKWCKDIKIASGGRLEIKVFPSGAIVPAFDVWEGVSKGVMEMGLSYGAFWVGKTPVAAFSVGIPFTARDTQDLYTLQKIGLEDLIRQAYAKQNIYYLRQNPCFATVLSSKKPVTSVDSLKGMKIRAVGIVGEMLAEAGAAVMAVPGPEIYGALEKGIVDAALWGSLSGQHEMGIHEVTKYIVMPPLVIEGDETIINIDAWKALPDDLKKLLYLSIADHTEDIQKSYRYDSEKALEDCLKKGLKVSEMPQGETSKLTKIGWKVIEKYAAKDPLFAKGAAILKDYLSITGIMK